MGEVEDTKEEAESKLKLLYELTLQMAKFGPVLATKMSVFSTLNLPWGLGPAGAESVKQGVDSGNAAGIAHLTAIMVKLGLLGTVHDIVVSLCAQDRAEAVASVTAELLAQGEVLTVVRISNTLIASGHTGDAVSISGKLITQGNTQVYQVIKESGLNMGSIMGDGDNDNEGGNSGTGSGSSPGQQAQGLLQNIQQQAAQGLHGIQEQAGQVIDRVTPNNSNKEAEKKTPDADALFSEWTGIKTPPTSPEVPKKADRLL